MAKTRIHSTRKMLALKFELRLAILKLPLSLIKFVDSEGIVSQSSFPFIHLFFVDVVDVLTTVMTCVFLRYFFYDCFIA